MSVEIISNGYVWSYQTNRPDNGGLGQLLGITDTDQSSDIRLVWGFPHFCRKCAPLQICYPQICATEHMSVPA